MAFMNLHIFVSSILNDFWAYLFTCVWNNIEMDVKSRKKNKNKNRDLLK